MRTHSHSLGSAAIALLAIVSLAGPVSAYYHSYKPAKTKAAGPVVEVTAKEFAFGPQAVVVKPGALTLRLENEGQYPHNLTIEQLGKGTTVSPGESGILSVNLKEGTYTIYCAVKGHRARGMQGTLVVWAGG